MAVYCLVFLAACSDMGDRDNPYDIHGTTFEDFWGFNDEDGVIDSSSSNAEDVNPYSSESRRGDISIVDKPSSSASHGGSDITIIDPSPAYSSATIIDNPDTPTPSSETIPVTSLGSCAPLSNPVSKGAAVAWKFTPNPSSSYKLFVIATYEWDFGGLMDDGSGSINTSGEVTYASPGIFSASVTVTMPDGFSEVIVCDELQVLDEQSSSSSLDVEKSSSSSVSWKCGDALVRDEVSYNTVAIKDRCWTKENMLYEPTAGYSMCYGGENTNCETYGRLYDYEAASLACPSGWRLPTSDEFIELQEYSGADMYDAGAWFKAANGWTGENGNDELGFSALPGGRCDYAQTCTGLGERGYWWTSTEVVKNASHYTLFLNSDGSTFSATTKMDDADYASVRCVKIE